MPNRMRLSGWIGRLLLARRALGVGVIGSAIAFCLLVLKPGELRELPHTWFDTLNQIWTRDRISEPVVIVAIDEASIAEVGDWPWPRSKMAQLFQRVAAGNPAAVGVDIFFSEREADSPASLARRPGAPPEAVAWLNSLPGGDDLLALAIATGPFVLGAGDRGAAPADPPAALISTIAINGPDPRGALARWRPPFAPLRSQERFREAAEGEGLVVLQSQFDGVVRRTGQAFDIGGASLAPGLAVEMLRAATGASLIVADTDSVGVRRLRLIAGRETLLVIPTEPDGSLRPWFGRRDPKREIPAIDLLANDAQLERLEGKLVLIGYAGAGGVDERVTPLEEVTPGVDIHRQTLEAMFDGRLLNRPYWAPAAEFGVAALLILAAAFVPIRRGVGPGTAMAAVMLLTPIVVSFAAYAGFLVVLDGATPTVLAMLAGLPVFAAHLVINERERRHADAVRSRIDGEMAAAKRLQMGILPNAAKAFPNETRFSIAASSEPARTVGGDLFDFFLLDDRRLLFLVGDVAGKGPEASLFMAIAKTMCKSVALNTSGEIGEVLSRAGAEIARDNPTATYVTAFAAVLDVETGRLEYCIAGHEPPRRVSTAGALEHLEGDGGPPLCLLPDFPYPTNSLQLKPGDMIVVITDGVTDAANDDGEMFGGARTDRVLAGLAGARSADAALSGLVGPVQAFADGEEPADDLTALVVIWPGPA